MRPGVICVLFLGAAAAFSQNLPTYAAASANPKTVVDYFLLCPRLESMTREGSAFRPTPR